MILSVFMLNWAVKGAIHFQKDIIVPDLVNKSLNEALDILTQHNLGLKKEGAEFNDTLPSGTILRQQPSAGSTVREGKIIRVTLSQGGEIVFLPDLAGQSLRAAEIALRNNFLSLGEISTQPSLKFEKDAVISQSPSAKQVIKKNSFVHLVISDGPPQDGTILMPDFTGKTWNEVLAWSKVSGISVEKNEDPSSELPFETISQQNNDPDSVLQPNTKIKFTVSSNKSGSISPATQTQKNPLFYFEVPQGESAKLYSFVLIDSFGSREVWRGNLQPGTKHQFPLPARIGQNARIRIFVNGILTEERNTQ